MALYLVIIQLFRFLITPPDSLVISSSVACGNILGFLWKCLPLSPAFFACDGAEIGFIFASLSSSWSYSLSNSEELVHDDLVLECVEEDLWDIGLNPTFLSKISSPLEAEGLFINSGCWVFDSGELKDSFRLWEKTNILLGIVWKQSLQVGGASYYHGFFPGHPIFLLSLGYRWILVPWLMRFCRCLRIHCKYTLPGYNRIIYHIHCFTQSLLLWVAEMYQLSVTRSINCLA